MSTIAREQQKQILIDTANHVINRDNTSPHSENMRELARIALASLEAEPAIHRWRRVTSEPYGPHPWHYGDFIGFSNPVDGLEDEYFYSAPPEPVSVPDLLDQFAEFMAAESIKSGDYPDGWQCKASNAAHEYAQNIHAAMLQGADNELQHKAAIHDALCEKYNVESLADFVDWQRNHITELEAAPPAPVGPGEPAVMPDYPGYVMTQRECYQAGKKAGIAEAGNSPVIQDGWVACSERMPEKADEVLCAKEFDGPGDWRQKVGYYLAGKWTVYSASWTPTHWMPLPAAPRQELK